MVFIENIPVSGSDTSKHLAAVSRPLTTKNPLSCLRERVYVGSAFALVRNHY